MVQFNKIELGIKLKEARIKKDYSVEYVAKRLGKSQSTVTRYELGKVIPNAIILKKLCDILDIYYDDLYKSTDEKILNKENSKNPFGVSKLYLYYLGFKSKNKIDYFKLIINLTERKDYIEVKIKEYGKDKTILMGHIITDNFMTIIRTENYKANCPRLEANQIMLNISGGTNGLIRGIMTCSNSEYVFSTKNVVVSKKDMMFDKNSKEILDYLGLDNDERKTFLKTGIWRTSASRENK